MAARLKPRAPSEPRITWATVQRLGLALRGTEVGVSWGSPALKVRGRMFAVIPTHMSAEPRSLCVRVPFADRDELLAADPDSYYVKEHYLNYPCVLVRLDRVHPDALRDLLRMGWAVESKKPRARARKRR
jgi:hypothetical protein